MEQALGDRLVNVIDSRLRDVEFESQLGWNFVGNFSVFR
jgi:hypothetical protein